MTKAEFIRMIAEIEPVGGKCERRSPYYPTAALNELIRKARLLLPYECNSSDVSVSGMERLRNQTEFMISIPVYRGITSAQIRSDMKADIQGYMQPEWFNYEAANEGIDAFCDQLDMSVFNSLEESSAEDDSVYLFTYWQAPEIVPVYQF
jgi:hypothetical protein